MSAHLSDVDLVSSAQPSGWHAITVYSPSRPVLGITGTLGGVVQWQFSEQDIAGLNETPGGETSKGPTSIHFRRVCTGNYCVDVVGTTTT